MKTKTVTIKVTQEDIDSGRKWRCDSCPVALAIEREVLFEVHVERHELRLYTVRPAKSIFIKLPEIAVQFISSFDGDEPREVNEPFSFNLELPVEVLK